MANTRRRTSGFEKPTESEDTPIIIDEDTMTDEQTETNEEVLTLIEPLAVIAESTPFIEESIVPTPDAGPRFLEVVEEKPAPVEKLPSASLLPAPKRHPRNIPKFSRSR